STVTFISSLPFSNWIVFTKTTPATTFQTPSLIACFRSGTTIPKTVTLGTGPAQVLAISSLAWAGIRPPRSEQSPARTIPAVFFNTHGQPLKLKAGDLHD